MAVPVAPTFVAIGAAVVVRILLWSKKESFLWNICIMALVILASFVTLEGEVASTFSGFWVGVGYGGMGQGILTLGKSTALGGLKDRIGKAVEVLLGGKTPPASE